MRIKMTNHHAQPDCPQINWIDGKPHSRQFGDVYFSSDSGLDETEHVFLAHNQLQQRWQALKTSHFTIAETGFGTGLNFLCAWRLWNECAPSAAQLHFVSIEKYPLLLADMTQALSLWPQLAKQRDQLLAQYHFLTNGFHSLVFDGGRIMLTLLIGDVNDMLPQLRANIDAWFLDGFAPAKNPEMWQQTLFNNMARLSHAETTFATFTSAGVVRRSLEAAGFAAYKVAGFGRKREMLCGRYDALASKKAINTDHRAIVKTARVFPNIIGNKLPNAIVIGGGIAGCASAHTLASRGWQVCLIERHTALAQEASGNPVAVLYPRLAGKGNALSCLALSGFLYTSRLLQQLGLNQAEYSACGLLQLAFDARELARCKAIAGQDLPTGLVRFVNKEEASALAGIALAHDGLYFSSAGWVNPPVLCRALANHKNIKVMTSSCALKIMKNGSFWQVWGDKSLLAEAPVLI
ncbi:MAG TPA: bifunctional tRNA (5-methylaminomethyl-2-thiouridine)(34)-methyltransferase MnmD/FAD-dependent 5-carboxymethylaminomethyl-2-thiouridine(34) oxidoreductase MnmC, partial [Methylophilaceae bacterium]|nr:bifunctional tRNA (5-methylaminomethyl-2-thiouridine)(34)-methyltransferase MnmD/FAD-dependent 5-carboxymethylaminomethyl-2-thiouridine(34) oxidoreductase MnmC [Methylophilaceae bacterium]